MVVDRCWFGFFIYLILYKNYAKFNPLAGYFFKKKSVFLAYMHFFLYLCCKGKIIKTDSNAKVYEQRFNLSSLSVDPCMQGKGLGTKFLDYLEDYVRERGGKQIVFYTNSQKNLNFYLHRGYELFDERVFAYHDYKMGSWSLKKAL